LLPGKGREAKITKERQQDRGKGQTRPPMMLFATFLLVLCVLRVRLLASVATGMGSIRWQQMGVVAGEFSWLLGLDQIAVADGQSIQVGAHEAAEGIFG
jgi:hypothetical protein